MKTFIRKPRFMLHTLLTIFIVSLIVLGNRLCYVPPNRPDLYYKAGIGYFAPMTIWAIDFSQDSKTLFIIKPTSYDLERSENILLSWNLEKDQIDKPKILKQLRGMSVTCFDIKDNELMVAISRAGKQDEQIFVLDLQSGDVVDHFEVNGSIFAVAFDENNNIFFSTKVQTPQSSFKYYPYSRNTYLYHRATRQSELSDIFLKYDSMSAEKMSYPLREINNFNDRKVIFNNKTPFLIIDDPRFNIKSTDIFEYKINSVAICNEKDYFAVVSSPTYMMDFPLSYHSLVHPTHNYTIVSLYRYSTGERVFCESYPNYPSYVCKISPDDKWLAVTVGGYVYVYDIDEITQMKK